VASLAVVALAFVVVSRLRAADDRIGATLVTAGAGLLISPISWTHHWVWVVPAFVWFGARVWRERVRWKTAAWVAALIVFYIGPHWYVTQYELKSRHPWTEWWHHVVGNAYVWIALAALVALAVGGKRANTTVPPKRAGVSAA
jgi:alpha-1,2-mannosyltransferase